MSNDKPMTVGEVIEHLHNRIEEELLKDQEALHEVLLQQEPDKNLVSFYEGSAASLRTVLLILEHMR